MKKLLPLFILICSSFVFGQTRSERAPAKPAETPKTEKTPYIETMPSSSEVIKAEEKLNKVITDAGIYFKQGLLSLKDNRRFDTGDQFNKSVEVFLMSSVNVRANQKLQNCYSQLIETIYRIESPSEAQLPQIHSLAATCGWNIENHLADSIVKIVKDSPESKTRSNRNVLQETTAVDKFNAAKTELNKAIDELNRINELLKKDATLQNDYILAKQKFDSAQLNFKNAFKEAYGSVVEVKASPFLGFNEQKFESSPLDELAKPSPALKEKTPPQIKYSYITKKPSPAGEKPVQQKDGKVQAVINYFNETFHDPFSMRFVRWSPLSIAHFGANTYWSVTVKFRAKNTFGAYVLTEETYYIKNGKVVTPIYEPTIKRIEDPTTVQRPAIVQRPMTTGNVRIVKAQHGDTVAKIAARAGANATEVAKFNGLLPESVLPAGREIKIPTP
jgi:LysM repeat protein